MYLPSSQQGQVIHKKERKIKVKVWECAVEKKRKEAEYLIFKISERQPIRKSTLDLSEQNQHLQKDSDSRKHR